MKQVPNELVKFMKSYDTYILAGHREPDGDCIGSCLALSAFLTRHGKKTIHISAGPFKRPEIKKYAPRFLPRLPDEGMAGKTAVVILDCSDLDRLGDARAGLDDFPRAILDHHATNTASGEIGLLDSTAPSTTVLVQSLIEKMEGTVTVEEAEFLLFGLCTDTGFFRHLDSQSAETFQCVARLVAAGANPKKTFAAINGGKSWESRILISRILSRMTRHYGGKLVVSYETMEDTLEYGFEGRDSDTLYQLIQSITDIEAIVIVRQETPTSCSVGFRSLDRIDVSKVASAFGGGGHRQASGLSITGKIEELIPRFIDAFAEQFDGLTP